MANETTNDLILTSEKLSSNLNHLFRAKNYSPSLYEEMFDEKKFNDLISDPLLSCTTADPNGTSTTTSSLRRGDEISTSENPTVVPAGIVARGTEKPVSMNPNFGDHQSMKSSFVYSPYYDHSRSSSKPSILRTVKNEPKDLFISSNHHDYAHDSSMSPASTISCGAAYAREYRQRNKKRIKQLENENERVRRENRSLKEAYERERTKTAELEREVNYLRRILANDTTIAKLMNAVVANTSGLKFRCPLISEEGQHSMDIDGNNLKRKIMTENGEDDESTNSTGRKSMKNAMNRGGRQESPGVCFHIGGDKVSLEFCSKCNRDAKRGIGDQQ